MPWAVLQSNHTSFLHVYTCTPQGLRMYNIKHAGHVASGYAKFSCITHFRTIAQFYPKS